MKTKSIEFPVFFDEETNEQTCARWFGSDDRPPELCKFLLMRKFGTQAVCGFSENKDLLKNTSRGFVKPNDDCPLIFFG